MVIALINNLYHVSNMRVDAWNKTGIIVQSTHSAVFTASHHNGFIVVWAASSEFGTYRLCEQRRFRQACAFMQSRQNLRCSLIQAVSQKEPPDRKPDLWPL